MPVDVVFGYPLTRYNDAVRKAEEERDFDSLSEDLQSGKPVEPVVRFMVHQIWEGKKSISRETVEIAWRGLDESDQRSFELEYEGQRRRWKLAAEKVLNKVDYEERVMELWYPKPHLTKMVTVDAKSFFVEEHSHRSDIAV